MDQEHRFSESGTQSTLVSLTLKESTLFKILRNRKYSRIEIQMKDGELGQVYVDEEISAANAKIEDVIRSNAFQTITFTKHDGHVIRINRRIPIKLD
jgi:hypothetical protein